MGSSVSKEKLDILSSQWSNQTQNYDQSYADQLNKLSICDKEAIIVIYTHKTLCNQEINDLKPRFTGYNNRMELLLRTLSNLYTNFLNKFNYPVLILYENYTQNDLSIISSTFPEITFLFEEIDMAIPSFLNEEEVHASIARKPVKHWRNLGYRHMCRFYAVDIFKHPIISSYKYYMRIDDDSVIRTPINTNIFKLMAEDGIDYVYRVRQKKDCNVCNEGMNEFFKSILVDYDYNQHLVPFNNFHIFRLGSIADKPILSNTEIVRNIYMKRWGDAPIHGAYIKMYALKAISTESVDSLSFEYEKWGLVYYKAFDSVVFS